MAKIGIITIHNSPNYGACLQSFALFEYLRTQGHEVEVIDLHRPAHSDYIPSTRFKPYSNRFETSWQRIKRLVKSILLRNNKDTGMTPTSTQITRATEKFTKFNKRIHLSETYSGIDQLYQRPPQYDVYITGSDQVWNPTQSYCIEPYFLTFVKQGRKISYASSIGITELTRRETKSYKKWLRMYDYISVREKTARDLLTTLTGKQINLVPDPTFLLPPTYWKQLYNIPPYKDYILVFTLTFDPKAIEFGTKLATESGKTLISLNPIQPTGDDLGYIPVADAGPEDWLGYIANADMIITDSFHCTVFSIILGTNFFTYVEPSNHRGSRIYDLLTIFNLNNHLIDYNNFESYSYGELNKRLIDNSLIKREIDKQQKIGRSFLSASI